jgi:hypothetical protein
VTEQNDAGSGRQLSNTTVTLRRIVRAQPKAIMIETQVVDVTGCMPLARAAEVQGVENVVSRLTEDGVIALNGLPFLHYLEWGYFVLGERAEILLTPKGLSWFSKRYPKVTH